ncbi:MAG: lysostaphin resistance A-like protein [Promethearchaeota archaeon]
MVLSIGKKRIYKARFTFLFYEVAIVFLFLFLILIIPALLLPLITQTGSIPYGVLFYALRAILVFLGIPLILYLTNLIFESQKKKVIIAEDISPSKGHLRLFKVSKRNYKYQILYGLLIFFLVFLPLDFFTYLFIPDMIEYQAWSLGLKNTNTYLLSNDYFIFLISVVIIQISVAITEENISRGFLAKRGSEFFPSMSAVIISSLYFGLGHFAYFLDLRAVEAVSGKSFPFWFPIIWFIQAFVIGIILALFVLRKKWLIPVIIAHALNNIVAAHSIWSFIQGDSFQTVALFVYIPLFIIGILFVTVCILLVWPFSSVKEGLSNGLNMFKTYFRQDSKESSKGDMAFRIFIDILIGVIIFLFGFLVAV